MRNFVTLSHFGNCRRPGVRDVKVGVRVFLDRFATHFTAVLTPNLGTAQGVRAEHESSGKLLAANRVLSILWRWLVPGGK